MPHSLCPRWSANRPPSWARDGESDQGRCTFRPPVGYPARRCTFPPPFTIDEAKIAEDARYDGKWILRTNTDLDTAEVALQYKRPWMVEHWFRSCKSLLQTRPIFHKRDETIRGHVFRSFLALVLRQELRSRLEERGHEFGWADVIQDLDRLQVVEVEQDGKRFLLRNEVQGTCGQVFQAVGVAVPPTVQQVSPDPPEDDATPSATPPD